MARKLCPKRSAAYGVGHRATSSNSVGSPSCTASVTYSLSRSRLVLFVAATTAFTESTCSGRIVKLMCPMLVMDPATVLVQPESRGPNNQVGKKHLQD